MTDDIDILAATAYETGISPVDYAAEHVIEAHIAVYLVSRGLLPDAETAPVSRQILGDLLDAGVTLPEVTR